MAKGLVLEEGEDEARAIVVAGGHAYVGLGARGRALVVEVELAGLTRAGTVSASPPHAQPSPSPPLAPVF